MSGLVMLLLIFGVLYIAFTYFKGPRNTDRYTDGITTRPFGGGLAGGDDLNPDEKDAATDDFGEGPGMDAAEDTDKGMEPEGRIEQDTRREQEDPIEPEGRMDPGAPQWDFNMNGPEEKPENGFIGMPDKETDVKIDSEVRIDAQMPSEPDTPQSTYDSDK